MWCTQFTFFEEAEKIPNVHCSLCRATARVFLPHLLDELVILSECVLYVWALNERAVEILVVLACIPSRANATVF
jgi:hypothetical protein